MNKVYIVPPAEWMEDFEWMFGGRVDYSIVASPEAADILVFTGGADINPKLYGEVAQKDLGVYPDDLRDSKEIAVWKKFPDKPKLAICRGSQLLNVLNGGSLWQHVNNHGVRGGHMMVEVSTGRLIHTSSVHHQMMKPGPDCVVICTASEADRKFSQKETWVGEPSVDHEVLWYPKDKALCIQGHPEYRGFDEFTEYTFELMEKYLVPRAA